MPSVVSSTDPGLSALTLNPPGNTPTMALPTGSSAINAADPATSLATDQRGVGRKGTPDIGAYETGETTTTTLASSKNPSTYGDSVTFTATVTNRTITDTPTGTLAIAIDGAPVITAASGSGSAMTATYSTSSLSAGSHTVVATYTNTGNFLPSGPASLTKSVTQATLTINANDAPKILDAPNPPFTATYSGFVNGDTPASLSGTQTCTTTATTTSPVGSYPITCSGQTSTNYKIVYVPGTLKILYAPAGTICDGAPSHIILPPINADGMSVFKQGRTVPAKFRVCDANGVSIGTPGVVFSFFLTGIQSGTTVTPVDDVVDTNNPDTAFRWDPTGLQCNFNITTAGLTGGSTYIYTITLNDGTTITFQYGLR